MSQDQQHALPDLETKAYMPSFIVPPCKGHTLLSLVLDPPTQILINNLDIYTILRRMENASSTKQKEEGSLTIGEPVSKSPFSNPRKRTIARFVQNLTDSTGLCAYLWPI